MSVTKATRQRCLNVAQQLIAQYDMPEIHYHDKLWGLATVDPMVEGKYQCIYVPYPTTPRRLYIFTHECGHVVLKHPCHNIDNQYIIEYEAETWTIEQLGKYRLPIPHICIQTGKEYVASFIHRRLRKGLDIRPDIINWCLDALLEITDQKILARLHREGLIA